MSSLLSQRRAAEVWPHVALRCRSLSAPEKDASAATYLGLLLDRGAFADGVRWLAAVMPHRESIWWGCVCAWMSKDIKDRSSREAQALRAGARWVLDPNEENRKQLAPFADTNAPVQLLVKAVRATGGSMAPEGFPVVPPPAALPGKYVAGALIQAAVAGPSEESEGRYQRFVALGMAIARGQWRWPGDRRHQS